VASSNAGETLNPADAAGEAFTVERRRKWALRRQEGLLAAAEEGTVELSFIEAGPGPVEGGGGPVLILHGLLGSSRNFVSWANGLSDALEKPRRIIIPDLRNHGESAHSRSMGYVHMARDVVGLLDRLGIARCCVIGHSMGGKVAATLALLHPERVESVGILDIAPADYAGSAPGPAAEQWKDIGMIIQSLNELPMHQVGTKKDADAFLAKTISDPILRAFALTNLVRREGKWEWKIGIKHINRNMGLIGGFDLGQGLQEPASILGMTFPRDTYFVQGGNSHFIRSRHLPEIQALFPNFTLQTIRNCGHWVHSEDPKATIDRVRGFLDRPDPTPLQQGRDSLIPDDADGIGSLVTLRGPTVGLSLRV